MSPIVRSEPFGETLQKIRAAIKFYKDLGIEINGTRLAEIHSVAQGLVRDLDKQRPPEEVVERWSNSTTYYAISDGSAFGDIAREFSRLASHQLPRRLLKEVLNGPLVPTDEIPGSANVNPRNHFLELELAADFMSKGIEVTGFDDVQFTFEDVHFGVQCKRLISEGAVEENLRKAYDQLGETLPDSKARGIVAVSIEKLFHLDSGLLRAASPNDVTQEVHRLHSLFHRRYHESWQQWIDPRVVGILVIVQFLVHTLSENVIGPARFTSLAAIVGPSSLQEVDLDRLRRLVTTLREAASQLQNTQGLE